MTAKTQGTLLTEIRDRLDEPTERFWTDVQIRKWINDGCRDIARKAECNQTLSTVSTSASTQEYDLPDAAIRVYRVEWKPDDDDQVYPLEFYDYNSMDHIWGTHKAIDEAYHPYIYTIRGYQPNLKILLFPTPSGAGTLNIYHYAMPALLATDASDASTAVDIPEGWEDLVVEYAVMLAYRKDGDRRWQEAKAFYDEHLAALIDASTRWSDQAGMIVPQSGVGAVPAWLYDGGYY